RDGNPVYLADLWPSSDDVKKVIRDSLNSAMFISKYADVYTGPTSWQNLSVSSGTVYNWPSSSYIKKAPFFDDMKATPAPLKAISKARCLVKVGDSITTDHISPAGSIAIHSPAEEYLQCMAVQPSDIN